MGQTSHGLAVSANLGERIRDGDSAAEDELVTVFRGGVFAMLLARTHDLEAARDLSQDVMLAVLRALREGKLRKEESLAAFIRGTALNLANKHIQTVQQRRRRIIVPDDPTPADPEEVLEFHDRLRLVQREVGRLDSTDRRILDLTFERGLSPAEIGEQLGLTPELVRVRKSRAVHRISERVKRLLRRRGQRH